MEDSKTEQLSFRIEGELLAKLDKACEAEDRKRADLARKIFVWAFEQYERAGSFHSLRQRKTCQSGRISDEAHQHLFTALGVIVDRAPSVVIEDVSRVLTARAGKYGDEK